MVEKWGEVNLTERSTVYTSNVYLVTGTNNGINDVNTLIDVGRDNSIIEKIKSAPTGVGKKKIERVILTHHHFDHTDILEEVKSEFGPEVYALSGLIKGTDKKIRDRETIKIGDLMFEVIATCGHTCDSICLYCAKNGVLFSGDESLDIKQAHITHSRFFIKALESLSRRDVRLIYHGHGPCSDNNCNKIIRNTLNTLRKNMSLGVGNYPVK